MLNNAVHQGQPVARAGAALADAEAAMIMVHGRGGMAAQILQLVDLFAVHGFAYLAPQAAGMSWYPNRFIAPRASNEPHLSSALQAVGDAVAQAEAAGIARDKIMLLGFSQGACLAGEYAARNPGRYGGVAVLSGGLIGAVGELTGYVGTLDGTPVLLGCSDVDFHIPVERVHESADVLTALGASVDQRIYPGMGHTINQEELDLVKAMMQQLL